MSKFEFLGIRHWSPAAMPFSWFIVTFQPVEYSYQRVVTKMAVVLSRHHPGLYICTQEL